MLNALSIDVEDYFQVTAFEKVVRREQWDHFPLRVVENTGRILDLLDEFSVRATFFVLGWIAERCPALVRGIVARGHEIACHGYGHELVYRIGPQRFREDVRRAKSVVEQAAGSGVRGYRAPSYSITGASLWALDILVEEGFTYDSSIFPVHHDTYGIPDAPRFHHRIATSKGHLHEFPLTTVEMRLVRRSLRLPIAGGAYLRFLPVQLLRLGIRHFNRSSRKPAILYLHPWELDPGQPRLQASLKSRIRHYTNLGTTERKLRVLLKSFTFAPISEALARDGVDVRGTLEAT